MPCVIHNLRGNQSDSHYRGKVGRLLYGAEHRRKSYTISQMYNAWHVAKNNFICSKFAHKYLTENVWIEAWTNDYWYFTLVNKSRVMIWILCCEWVMLRARRDPSVFETETSRYWIPLKTDTFPANKLPKKYVIIASEHRFDVVITYILRTMLAAVLRLVGVRLEKSQCYLYLCN